MDYNSSPTNLSIILHAYQPITQDEEVLQRIIKNCYIPFLRNLYNYPEVKVSINFSGCLLEKLHQDYPSIIDLIKEGIENNQIELLGSAFYHPILPLLSSIDQKYQIKKQQDIIYQLFNVIPETFFPPEMAVDSELIELVSNLGFKCVIAPTNVVSKPVGALFQGRNEKQIVVLKRNKDISNRISFNQYHGEVPKTVIDVQKQYKKDNFPVVIAMDLETYGEHIPHYHQFLYSLANSLSTCFVSELDFTSTKLETIREIYSTSWSTSDEDLEKNIPYPLWDNPENSIHQLQHAHMALLYNVREKLNPEDIPDSYHAAHYSCQFWWASGKWWSNQLIELGLNLQKKALLEMLNCIPLNEQKIILNLSKIISSRIMDIIQRRG